MSPISRFVRLAVLMAPLALTPMLLQALGERVWEHRLRVRIHRSLVRRRALGLAHDLRADLGTRSPGAFGKLVLERKARLVVMAYGTASGGYHGRSLTGCLDHRTGTVLVQQGFASAPPLSCLDTASPSSSPPAQSV